MSEKRTSDKDTQILYYKMAATPQPVVYPMRLGPIFCCQCSLIKAAVTFADNLTNALVIHLIAVSADANKIAA